MAAKVSNHNKGTLTTADYPPAAQAKSAATFFSEILTSNLIQLKT
jgi:hypothetical protein